MITVKKITDESYLHRANSFTTKKGSSMSLEKAYALGHSPIRTQLFWVECTEIPLFVASQLVRSHIGVQFFQLSKRTDRGGEDFNEVCNEINAELTRLRNTATTRGYTQGEDYDRIMEVIGTLPKSFDRNAPTDLAFIINADALMNMAHKRLCTKASNSTRAVVKAIKECIKECDPALYSHLVPQCIYRNGLCPESKSCGYYTYGEGSDMHKEYINSMRKK